MFSLSVLGKKNGVRRNDEFMKKDVDKSSASNYACCRWGCMVPANIVWKIGALKELAEKFISLRLDRTKSTASELVNKLEQYGLMKRCECTVDGRVYHVALTDKGWSFEKDLSKVVADLNAALCKGFGDEERAAVKSMILRMKENLLE